MLACDARATESERLCIRRTVAKVQGPTSAIAADACQTFSRLTDNAWEGDGTWCSPTGAERRPQLSVKAADARGGAHMVDNVRLTGAVRRSPYAIAGARGRE